MRNKREHRRLAVVLILAVACLITCTAPFLTSSGLASAQAVAPNWSYTGSLNAHRSSHTATLLPNGKVLVAGGSARGGVQGSLNSAELYDPATRTWSVTGSLNVPRAHSTATLLTNGQVLVAGGYEGGSRVTNTAELYDLATGTWSLIGNLNTPRNSHTATLLQNGKVLIAGGWNGSALLHSAELYDPSTGTWSVTGRLSNTGGSGRSTHTATLLPNGKVLVAGGGGDEEFFVVFSSTELYDPNTGTWSVTGRLNSNRYGQTATLLPDGRVLVAGGWGLPCSGNNSAELYDPATGAWSYTGSLSCRGGHTATLLPNGQVLAAGGYYAGYDVGRVTLLDSAELYNAATGTWSGTARVDTARSSHTATLLQNGQVLVAGGYNNTSGTLNSAELYDPAITSTANPIDDPQFFVRQHYLDFLNREPDPVGFQGWLAKLNQCPESELGNRFYAQDCTRIDVSASFFRSREFSFKGYYVYRFYQVSYGRRPLYAEFLPDTRSVTGATDEEFEQRRAAFPGEWVTRQAFKEKYDALSNSDYVNMLLQTTGVTLAGSNALVDDLNSGQKNRAQVLREIVESTEVEQKFYDEAFVAMQYFGYLRRDPDADGYNGWLNHLNRTGNYREMVWGFLYSPEYKLRFGPVPGF